MICSTLLIRIINYELYVGTYGPLRVPQGLIAHRAFVGLCLVNYDQGCIHLYRLVAPIAALSME